MEQIDHSWDFATAKTKYYTHGIHPYPAMMIPQVAKRLIAENGNEAKTALDPFCGSGSVLLEFKLAGINSYGVDINPLAVLISKAKTTPIDPIALATEWEKIQKRIDSSKQDSITPTFFNIDFWFKKPVAKKLAVIKNAIEKITDENGSDCKQFATLTQQATSSQLPRI